LSGHFVLDTHHMSHYTDRLSSQAEHTRNARAQHTTHRCISATPRGRDQLCRAVPSVAREYGASLLSLRARTRAPSPFGALARPAEQIGSDDVPSHRRWRATVDGSRLRPCEPRGAPPIWAAASIERNTPPRDRKGHSGVSCVPCALPCAHSLGLCPAAPVPPRGALGGLAHRPARRADGRALTASSYRRRSSSTGPAGRRAACSRHWPLAS